MQYLIYFNTCSDCLPIEGDIPLVLVEKQQHCSELPVTEYVTNEIISCSLTFNRSMIFQWTY